jgi:hypothetical protein
MAQSGKYWINARWTLGTEKKIFIVFLLGRDTRGPASPLESEIDPNLEQRKAPATSDQVMVYTGMFFWALFSVAAMTFTFLYLLKSGLGINLFEGSPFPSFLKSIGICH